MKTFETEQIRNDGCRLIKLENGIEVGRHDFYYGPTWKKSSGDAWTDYKFAELKATRAGEE